MTTRLGGSTKHPACVGNQSEICCWQLHTLRQQFGW